MENMFFVIPEMPSKTFVMVLKKLPDHFKCTTIKARLLNLCRAFERAIRNEIPSDKETVSEATTVKSHKKIHVKNIFSCDQLTF